MLNYTRDQWSWLSILLCLFLCLGCSEGDFEPPLVEGEEGNGELHDLPRIEISVTGEIPDEPKKRSLMKVFEGGKETYSGVAGIEIRGASSQMFDKKSYGLETWDNQNEDINVSLLGMPEEEDWVLHGPYSDKSLMRNKLIYDLGRDLGRYAPRTSYVELYINGDYKGVYVFTEKLKRNKNRIAIEKLRPDENSGDDLTGGYILKIDKVSGNNIGEGYNDQNSFASRIEPLRSSGKEIRFLYEYPDAREITDPQKNYIQNYIHEFEAALSSENFSDPVGGYAAYIDVDSFIDFFIANEITNNIDGYRLSTYMHKDKNGKLSMGPIWDFNLGFGNAGYCGGSRTDVWAYKFNDRCPDDYWYVPFWWPRLLEDPNFVSALQRRWNEVRSGVLSEESILSKIRSYQVELNAADAITRNFLQWPIIGQWIWPNEFVGNTYTEERQYLEDWITDRMTWLDMSINGLQ